MGFNGLKGSTPGGCRKASVLILVLIVVASLTILAAGMAYRTRIEIRLAAANAAGTKAYYLALGGIERAKALITNQELSPKVIAAICCFTGSAKQEGLLEQLTQNGPIEHQELTYSVRDEKAYLNLNSSDPACWENLALVPKECLAAITDWIDEDGDTSPDGAETDFYQRLELPHVAKNKPINALNELLYIKAVNRRLYLGEDLNRNLVLDENEADGMKQLPPDNEDSTLDLGLIDVFTVCGDGKININTAPRLILASLPGLDEQAAEAILAYRYGPDGRAGTDGDNYITDPQGLADLEQLTELERELLRQYCCFDSGYLRIFSQASVAGGFTCCLMATIRLNDRQPEILCLERLL